MKKICYLSLIFIFLSNNLFSQKIDGIITKEEMYKEFDYLADLLKEANPHFPIYKKVMKFDIEKYRKTFRKNIDTITNFNSYYNLIYKYLSLVPELHTRFFSFYEIKDTANWNKKLDYLTIDNYSFSQNQLIDNYFNNFQNENLIKSIHLPIIYVNGVHYLTRPIELLNLSTKTKVLLPQYSKIIKINNQSINQFIKDNLSFNNKGWDFEKNCYFFDDDIYIKPNGKMSLFITYYNPKDKKEYKAEVFSQTAKYRFAYLYDEEEYKNIEIDTTLTIKNKILFFDSILFIKLISMIPDSVLINDISKYKNKNISKVVIDIRGNRGGSDNVWVQVLSAIIDTNMCRHQTLGVNDSKYTKKILDSFKINFDSLEYYYDKNLNKKYRVFCHENKCLNIKPTEITLNYKGKIYVLHDRKTYSAAGSLLAFALGNERVVSVGIKSGKLLGYGSSPFVYQLPYSKLFFVMHSTIHIPLNAKKLEDYFWNGPEIEVNSTPFFESFYELNRNFYDIFNEKFLKEHDVYFKKVLELN